MSTKNIIKTDLRIFFFFLLSERQIGQENQRLFIYLFLSQTVEDPCH